MANVFAHSLADDLAYEDIIDDVVIFSDGSVGIGYSIDTVYIDNMDLGELLSLERNLSAFLLGIDKDVFVQVQWRKIAGNIPALDNHLDGIETGDPIVQQMCENRHEFWSHRRDMKAVFGFTCEIWFRKLYPRSFQGKFNEIWDMGIDEDKLVVKYMKEQNVFAWSRHVTDGRVVSLTVINGDEGDVVMLVVERAVDGQAHYFLERLADRFRDADRIEDAFFVDCGLTVKREEADEEVSGLSHLEGCTVAVLADGSPVEGLTVENGKIVLPYPAKTVSVGLGFTSALSPLPLESDTEAGSTLGKRRAYGKCVLRLYRSVGGKYAATSPGDLWLPDAWQGREAYDIPFVPDVYGEACQPFSGDVEITLPSGQDADTSIWLMQDRPMPFRVAAIMMDVDFGEV